MSRRCLLATAHRHLPAPLDDGMLAAHRRGLLRRASGRVLDLSTMWEPDLPAYHRGALTSLTVTGRGRPGAGAPGVPTPAVVAGIDDAPPAAFDYVVVCFTLCTTARPAALLASAAARLVPGGQVLVLEHVGGTGVTGVVQHVVDPVAWRLRTGCRLDLDVPAGAAAAGLVLADCARFRLWAGGLVPTPCLAGALVPRPTPPTTDPRGAR